MAKKPDIRTAAVKSQAKQPDVPDRDEELSTQQDIKDALLDLYKDVEKGFSDQWERANDQMDYWDIYNCKLGQQQFYNGNSQIFVPIVHDAINARVTRFVNQLFPQSGRYVEATTEDGTLPHALMSLLEHYVKRTRLRSRIAPALLRNGDVEGQYNLYVSWKETDRHVVMKTTKDVEGEPVEDIVEETVVDARPDVEVLADADVLVLPVSSDSVDDALENGGSVTVLRRWSKAKIKRMIKNKEIDKEEGEALVKAMSSPRDASVQPDKAKQVSDAAGVKGTHGQHALVYETWTQLTIDDERRLCRVFFGGDKMVLGCKRNPFWSDRCPVISASVDKVQGVFKGVSKIKPVAKVQYQANDATNEAMDSAAYALMPIIMTDPARNPRIGSMVLSLAAIWETSPNDTQFAKFPPLWKEGLEIVAGCRSQIMQTLNVNPSMITQQSGKSKPSQADVAREQQVDILTTSDVVMNAETECLSPMLNRWIELDHQYRDDEITVRSMGEPGMRARMEKIAPIQFEQRYYFRWFGVEAARNAQQVQQQIAGINVLRGIPPQQYEGYRLNLIPVITQLVENVFGPRLAPLIFENTAQQMPVPAQQENILLLSGFEVPTHMQDNDDEHIQAHVQLMQLTQGGEVPPGAVKKIQTHLFAHMQQKAKKEAMAAQMAAQQQGQGLVGAPGGAAPGIAGTPRIGAQPGAPRSQGPPGMIHQDSIGPQSGSMPRMRARG